MMNAINSNARQKEEVLGEEKVRLRKGRKGKEREAKNKFRRQAQMLS